MGCPVTTDVHEPAQAAPAASVVDLLQVPAFLCRQTDLLVACGATGAAVNVKKAQFLDPRNMKHAVAKVRSTGNTRVLVTERGTTFGYGNLVVDMRSLALMRARRADGLRRDARSGRPGASATAPAATALHHLAGRRSRRSRTLLSGSRPSR